MTRRMPSVFAGALRLRTDRRRRVKPRQLDPAVAVRGPQHGDVLSDAVEPDDTFHPAPLEWPLALQLHAELDEELNNGLEIIDNDEDVGHPLNRHMPERSGRRSRRHCPAPQLQLVCV